VWRRRLQAEALGVRLQLNRPADLSRIRCRHLRIDHDLAHDLRPQRINFIGQQKENARPGTTKSCSSEMLALIGTNPDSPVLVHVRLPTASLRSNSARRRLSASMELDT
jgi:hypothetical protein